MEQEQAIDLPDFRAVIFKEMLRVDLQQSLTAASAPPA
jgi:hypothetical protein